MLITIKISKHREIYRGVNWRSRGINGVIPLLICACWHNVITLRDFSLDYLHLYLDIFNVKFTTHALRICFEREICQKDRLIHEWLYWPSSCEKFYIWEVPVIWLSVSSCTWWVEKKEKYHEYRYQRHRENVSRLLCTSCYKWSVR